MGNSHRRLLIASLSRPALRAGAARPDGRAHAAKATLTRLNDRFVVVSGQEGCGGRKAKAAIARVTVLMTAAADIADVSVAIRTSRKAPSVQLAYVLGSRLLLEFGRGSGNASNGVDSRPLDRSGLGNLSTGRDMGHRHLNSRVVVGNINRCS